MGRGPLCGHQANLKQNQWALLFLCLSYCTQWRDTPDLSGLWSWSFKVPASMGITVPLDHLFIALLPWMWQGISPVDRRPSLLGPWKQKERLFRAKVPQHLSTDPHCGVRVSRSALLSALPMLDGQANKSLSVFQQQCEGSGSRVQGLLCASHSDDQYVPSSWFPQHRGSALLV